MDTTISKIDIYDFYAYIDLMPIDDNDDYMIFTITFNQEIKKENINQILLFDENGKLYNKVDVKTNNNYSYQIRDNDIIIRCNFNCKKVSAHVVIVDCNNNKKFLKTDKINVESVS